MEMKENFQDFNFMQFDHGADKLAINEKKRNIISTSTA